MLSKVTHLRSFYSLIHVLEAVRNNSVQAAQVWFQLCKQNKNVNLHFILHLQMKVKQNKIELVYFCESFNRNYSSNVTWLGGFWFKIISSKN